MTGTLSTPDRAHRHGLVAVVLTVPLLTASLGVDGGPIFQIAATEDLGIGATALATAFGLGVLTVPAQLAAARLPIHHARRNLQRFLVACAVLTWSLAGLIGLGTSGPIVTIALAITVLAELSVSILFATAWQPLLASLDATERQRLNSRYPAAARVLLAAAVAVFGFLGSELRAVFLIAAGCLAVVTARALGAVPPAVRMTAPTAARDAGRRPPNRHLRGTFLALALTNLAAMPLWLVYVDEVVWAKGNLGLVAAAQIVASTLTMATWRATDGPVIDRVVVGCLVMVVAVASVTLLDGPSPDRHGQALVLVASALMGVGTTLARVGLVEHAHRLVDPGHVVRTFTVLDVVASTSLQAGLFLAGPLIAAARTTSEWGLDPYEILLATSATAALAVTWRIRATT